MRVELLGQVIQQDITHPPPVTARWRDAEEKQGPAAAGVADVDGPLCYSFTSSRLIVVAIIVVTPLDDIHLLLLLIVFLHFIVLLHFINDHINQDDQEASTTPKEEEVWAPHLSTTNISVTVHLGATAALDCVVHDLHDEPVSWLRRVGDVLELLTWDTHTYTSDVRYSLVRETGDRWRRWQLVILDSQLNDQGQYRCQVATQPPLLLSAALTVIEPRARVVDERGEEVREKHYNSGSMIELKCVIDQVPFPPGPVTWRRGATTLSFNTSRGGISVRGEPAWGYIRSRLYVADARPSDSGVYSCWYSNYTSDALTVHVLAGENSAAMQHDASPGASSSESIPTWSFFTYIYHLYLLAATCLSATCTTT
ncbi:Obscurin-like 1 [Homarus americanus]|uniref:Obscurin-like 1 n=1 Tax=Homarus americanus TaxID=6706 RepID=A0A8J5TIZ6_HOMAM|nr:Obscurin-like 1 [Homarus americanus]